MPIYEYSCQSCGKTIDVLQKVSDPTPEACTACGATNSLTKLVSRSSFVLKGGGWYSDLYSSTKKDGGSSDGGADSGSSGSSSSGSNSAASSGGSTPSSGGSTPSSGGSTPSSGGSTPSSGGGGTSSSSSAPVAAAPAR
jgi:putative FmdB family regulatory protein